MVFIPGCFAGYDKVLISYFLDELVGFEEAWKGNARKHLPGWSEEFASQDALGMLLFLLLVSRYFQSNSFTKSASIKVI